MSAFKRSDRVADAIKEEVAGMLQREVKDPRVGFVTLTGVEVTPDLRHARIFYSVVGDAAERAASQQGLDSASGFVQREVGRRLRLRHTPTLEFRFDGSIERGARIESLLREVKGGSSTEPAAASLGAGTAQAGGAEPMEPGGESPSAAHEQAGGTVEDGDAR